MQRNHTANMTFQTASTQPHWLLHKAPWESDQLLGKLLCPKPETVCCSCQISITKIQHKALQSQHTCSQKKKKKSIPEINEENADSLFIVYLVIVQLARRPKDKPNPKMYWHSMRDIQPCNFPCKKRHLSPSSVPATFPSSDSSLSISERKTGREKDWARLVW